VLISRDEARETNLEEADSPVSFTRVSNKAQDNDIRLFTYMAVSILMLSH
jgi:hypothetical protein